MPQFAPRRALIEAHLFDGSMESAISCARNMGKALRIVVDDVSHGLMMGRTKIKAGTWIISGSKPRLILSEDFERLFVGVGDFKKPALLSMDRGHPPVIMAPPASEIEEGDTVVDVDDPDARLYEALEFDPAKRTWFCDSVWGTRDIAEANLKRVRKGFQAEDPPGASTGTSTGTRK